MTLYDLVRVLVFATFGGGMGFAILTNVIAFQVLRPPHKLGFLWWHVTSITLAFLFIGIVAVERVAGALGDPPSWRTFVCAAGTSLFLVAQIIIFLVERGRLIHKKAIEAAAAV